jgi:predicted AlkP superfamily pyrophosphatase or phosphodiesterase
VRQAREALVSGRRTFLGLLPATAVAALLATSCGGAGSPAGPSGPPPEPPAPPPPPRVVILSIDGLRPDALQESTSPNIMSLARRGTVSMSAQTVFMPVTLVSHASMLSGYLPARHGLSWDDYRPERGLIRVPTIFSVVKAASRRTVFVAGKEKLQHLLLPGTVDTFVLAPRGDDDVANAAVVQAGSGFDLMFVHLPMVDIVGHSSRWMSERFLGQVTTTDAAVGRILAALPAGTTVILTADHGGVGTTHGMNQPSDMTIPWIIAGPDVVAGQTLPVTLKVSTMDTAATALKVLGLTLPPDASGRVVDEAFQNRSASRR